VEPVGALVGSFIVPLELCPTTNFTRHGQIWKLAKLKSQCELVMRAQYREHRTVPLPGRPMVRCIRFSSVAPDRYCDSFKIAIDRLVGLKLIKDDKPALCDVHQLWEFAAAKSGFGLIEVFTGSEPAKEPRARKGSKAA
jgi:hypothetical protein